MPRVVIVDYGSSNLLNVARAFEYCGARVSVTDDPTRIAAADRIVLPGVGAFADGMAGLRARHLDDALRDYIPTGRPLLGICLGMQLLFEESNEFGLAAGLGIIKGGVERIPEITSQMFSRKVPHVGWSDLHPWRHRQTWKGTFLSEFDAPVSMYFVHSYSVLPQDEAVALAECNYQGHRICAAIESANIYGCQFHPEKSGCSGLRLLRRFTCL